MTVKERIWHYLAGLGAASWNAGIAAVYATMTQGAGAALTEMSSKISGSEQLHQIAAQTLPTAREIALIFTGAAVIESLRWLKDHPLPEPKFPEDTDRPSPPFTTPILPPSADHGA